MDSRLFIKTYKGSFQTLDNFFCLGILLKVSNNLRNSILSGKYLMFFFIEILQESFDHDLFVSHSNLIQSSAF